MNGEEFKKIKLEALIQEHFDDLTKSEKRIATFLLQKPEEAAFLSVSELAAQLDLSEATAVALLKRWASTVTGTARRCKFISHQVTHSARIKERLSELRQDGSIFEQLVASRLITSLRRTYRRPGGYWAGS
jgi:DNA-binding MarR family transcriptional regulator